MAVITDLDNIDSLMSLLGSFWSTSYAGRNVIEGLCQARLELEKQSIINWHEAENSRGATDIDPWHTERWTPWSIRSKDIGAGRLAKFGGGSIFGESGSKTTVFGGSADGSVGWAAPADLHDCHLISNGITGAPIWLVSGLDFSVEDGRIVFWRNPFTDNRFTQYQTDDGKDVEIPLFLFNARYDQGAAYEQYGAALGHYGTTSQEYVDSLAAELTGLSANPSSSSFRKLASAMADVDLVKEDGEVVEVIQTSSTQHLVITDKNVYKLSSAAALLVAVGDVLKAEQPLTAALRIDFLNSGLVPAGLTFIDMPASFFGGITSGTLRFENSATAVSISTVSGKTKITFALTGAGGDVTAFFTALHANGVATGNTLANYLDNRPKPAVGEPTSGNLPATINPLKFLLENVFRGNAVLIRGAPAAYGPNAVGFSKTLPLRRMLSPFVALLIQEA